MNLTHKTLYFIMPIIIAPILVIGSVAFYKLNKLGETSLTSQATTVISQISDTLHNNIANAEANLKLLAEHQIVKQYALTTDASLKYQLLLPHLLDTFKGLQNSIQHYYEIRFILPDGFEDAHWSGNILNISDSIANEPYYNDLMTSTSRLSRYFFVDKNTDKPAIGIFYPISLSDPAVDDVNIEPVFRGFLGITISLDSLSQQINEYRLGKTGFLAISDKDYSIIISPYPDLNNDLTTQVGPYARVTQKDIIDNVHTSSGMATVFTRPLPAGMHILAILPESEITNSSYQLSKIIFIITLLVLSIATIIIYKSIRHIILTPVETLNTATKSIGLGEHVEDLDIQREDELGDLAKTITEMNDNLKRSHDKVSYIANHDSLTGLPNRSLFQSYLSKILSIAKQKDGKVALLFIDLDDFKNINDTLGHNAGDLLLCEFSTLLTHIVRKNIYTDFRHYDTASDLVARLGGDEFIVLLHDVEGPWEASAVSERIIRSLKEPFDLLDNQVYVGCSIGIAIYPDDASSPGDMIQFSDIAMYHAKNLGKNHYQFYSKQLNQDLQERLQINNRLRVALDNDAFTLVYQPKINLITGYITGLEALIRWTDDVLGQVSPAVFIPIAEESGLITPLTEWILSKACEQNKAWINMGIKVVPVSVNVSSIQFRRRDLLSMVNRAIKEHDYDPALIQIELTETSLLDSTQEAIEIIDGLSRSGISIALDDFGTGYSSLAYLNTLPINTLKIDKSFVSRITSSNESYPIIDAILALAGALRLDVVAEGVENEEQLVYLKKHGCQTVQGFYLSRPLPADQLQHCLENSYASLTSRHA